MNSKILGGIFIAIAIVRVVSGDLLAAITGFALGATFFINPKQSENHQRLYYAAFGIGLCCLIIRLIRWLT